MADLLVGAIVAGFGVLAVAVGSPLTLLVFRLVDRREPPAGGAAGRPAAADARDGGDPASVPLLPGGLAEPLDRGSVTEAAASLRGGLWIGLLERAAVYASVLAGWPEGLAVILAVKGLGRYPELRARLDAGIAERFIIGTFTSVLCACACAGLARLVVFYVS
jgi:hypothetical protein